MMKRRQFFRNSSLAALGSLFLSQANGQGENSKLLFPGSKGKAKNIIVMVSDGMSTGTLNMADMLLQRKMGKVQIGLIYIGKIRLAADSWIWLLPIHLLRIPLPQALPGVEANG